MEPIKVDEQHALQINLALAKALPTVHADDGASDVILMAQHSENALDKIGLPAVLRPGVSVSLLCYEAGDLNKVKINLLRRSSAWWLTGAQGNAVLSRLLTTRITKTIYLPPKQYRQINPQFHVGMSIARDYAPKNEIIKITSHYDETANAKYYLVTFDDPEHLVPLVATVPAGDGPTVVLVLTEQYPSSIKPLDASKYDGWLRVQISKWEAKRK
ncbi:MAG: hypothetical protein ACYCU8_00610 [Ferrimicrobium acidiphilum]